jgi:hypothetical protein
MLKSVGNLPVLPEKASKFTSSIFNFIVLLIYLLTYLTGKADAVSYGATSWPISR